MSFCKNPYEPPRLGNGATLETGSRIAPLVEGLSMTDPGIRLGCPSTPSSISEAKTSFHFPQNCSGSLRSTFANLVPRGVTRRQPGLGVDEAAEDKATKVGTHRRIPLNEYERYTRELRLTPPRRKEQRGSKDGSGGDPCNYPLRGR